MLALDIDGVLNNGDDHALLRTLVVEQGLTIEQIHEDSQLPYRFFDRGNFVNVNTLQRLQELVRELDVTVVGISSWFTSKRSLDAIGSFLGLDIQYTTSSTSGGEDRVRALGDIIVERRPERLVVLDDQWHYYEAYGFTPHHVQPVNGLSEEDISSALTIACKPLDIHRLTVLRSLQDCRRIG